jgi:hypothetical protein
MTPWTLASRTLILAASALSLCACATGATSAGAAAVPVVEPTDGHTVYNYECDSRRGGSSTWSRPVSGSGVAVSGTMLFEKFKHDPMWAQTAGVGAVLGDKKTITLELVRNSDTEYVALLIDSTEPSAARIMGSMTIYPKPIHFYMQVTPDSVVHVAIGRIRGSARIAGPHPTIVQLGCSTSKVRFGDVAIASP